MVQGVCYLPSSKTSLAGVRNCNTPFSLYPFILCGSWVLLSLAAPNQLHVNCVHRPTMTERKDVADERKKNANLLAPLNQKTCAHTHTTRTNYYNSTLFHWYVFFQVLLQTMYCVPIQHMLHQSLVKRVHNNNSSPLLTSKFSTKPLSNFSMNTESQTFSL